MIEKPCGGIDGVISYPLAGVDGGVVSPIYRKGGGGRGIEDNHLVASLCLGKAQLVRGAEAKRHIGGVFLAA